MSGSSDAPINLGFAAFIMSATRDTFCNLQRMEIPRPQISGLEFVPTRGRLGFYKSIQKSIPTAPRRPPLSEVHFTAPPPDYDTACNLNDHAQTGAANLSSASGNHEVRRSVSTRNNQGSKNREK
uniref:Uncharacterized protein n=1 Tax=Parascaris univalens TaxID=6257 RepID=A0A915AV60_PARUN